MIIISLELNSRVVTRMKLKGTAVGVRRGTCISPLVLDCSLVVGILALTLPGGFKMDHET